MADTVITVNTFGDFQKFNHHLHLIATDGFFSGGSTFLKKPGPVFKNLQELFRYERAMIKELERENNEFRRANEILRKASDYFAQAYRDCPPKR